MAVKEIEHSLYRFIVMKGKIFNLETAVEPV